LTIITRYHYSRERKKTFFSCFVFRCDEKRGTRQDFIFFFFLVNKMSSIPVIIARISATAETAEDEILEYLRRDGVVIVTGMFSRNHIEQVKQDLAPHFDSDVVDESGFFPSTTQRATGLFGISRACVDTAMHPLFLAVANRLLTSTYTFYVGSTKKIVHSKPIISSTVGFRVNPGGEQQGLHRDCTDFHTRPCDWPMMIGCVTALTRTHKNNGATIVIPGSHLWEDENRIPLVEEAIPAELEPGDATIFVGNLYHAGGANITQNEWRETVGIFMAKGFYRQAENEYLTVPPERCKELQLTPAELRVLGYGISEPSCGFFKYKDPMESVFGIIDNETIKL
jgi:ectoine hydroxylase-related dioxygenase (phytanoyl-CoA dioxygenase family)